MESTNHCEYNEELIMIKVSKMLDSISKHFNQHLLEYSHNGSDLLTLSDEDSLNRTDSIYTSRISVDGHGRKKPSIKSEAFRYGHNIFALLLHNTDVAKSLVLSRFIQKQIIDLCSMTTEFRYNPNYLTVSMAIANLHYNDNKNKVIDSYKSWYKRCSDALKTIRYEGGNGVTHADILFGAHINDKKHHKTTMGIVHTAGSNPSEPGIGLQFQHSLENNFNHNNSYYIQQFAEKNYTNNISHSLEKIMSPTTISPLSQPSNLHNQLQANSPPKTQQTNDKKNKTITWITGRLDRKYTFV